MIKKIKLGNFYRPPGMEAQYGLGAALFQQIRKLVEGNNLVVIVGNFNFPDIEWCNREYTSPTSGNFIYICKDMSLNKCVEEGAGGGNTLDLIFFKWGNNIKFESRGKFWS